MPTRTRTLGNLRSDVCLAADITDGGATGRHTTANINRRINQAVQQFRRLVTECGSDIYIAQSPVSTNASATPDAANWAPRDYLALPTDFYHLKGIDISLNGTTVSMMNFDQFERNLFRQLPAWLSNSGVGMPVLYKLGGYNAAGTRVVKVIPSADTVYQCNIWYLPIAPELVNDNDVFDGLAGYEDWVVNRASMDLLSRDQASQPTYAALQQANAELANSMAFEFASSNGPSHRVDTQALRNYLEAASRWKFGMI